MEMKTENVNRIQFTLSATIVICFIAIILLNAKDKENYDALKSKADSLENVNRALRDSLEIFKAPLTPSSLKTKLEYAFQGNEWADEFAHGFVAVAIQESGECLCLGASQRTNGLWGFHYRHHSPYKATHYNNGYGETFTSYLSLEDAILDVRLWIKEKPPIKGERFIDFIERRGYNPTEGYYATIERGML